MTVLKRKKLRPSSRNVEVDESLPLSQRLAFTVPLVTGAGGDDPDRPIFKAPRSAGFASVSPNNQVTRTVPVANYRRAVRRQVQREAHAALVKAAQHQGATSAATMSDRASSPATIAAPCDCDKSHVELGATAFDVTPLGAAALLGVVFAFVILKVL
ncbi:MAG TPA: hypothetical protein VGG10_15290 [Rhizomicrobium sp.]